MLKKDLEQKVSELEYEKTALFLALNDLVKGKTEWVQHEGFAAGLSRLGGASGGIIILTDDKKNANAYFLDDWLIKVKHPGSCYQVLAIEAEEARDKVINSLDKL